MMEKVISFNEQWIIMRHKEIQTKASFWVLLMLKLRKGKLDGWMKRLAMNE